jgi:hypothetical protein
MPDERRQFRILYRDFLFRIVDLDLLSPSGEIQNLLVQLAALLAAFNFVVAVLYVPRYATSILPSEQLLMAAWGDQEFLIATTIAIAGLFAVLSWNALFPDRRDSFVLGPLPVRTGIIFAAKIAALATALGISVAAINIFTGLFYPFLVTPPQGSALRSFSAYWVTMTAAGLLVFCALLAVQGLAALLLRYRLFLRLSSFLQLAAFFLILGVYFLTPALATLPGLTASANRHLLAWLPSFWFLALFQELNGTTHLVFGPLAERAVWSLFAAISIAGATYPLAYYRNFRRIIEQPDIAPTDRSRRATRIGRFIAARYFSRSLESAIFLFMVRTIARSRQHRLLLAAYGGAGLAIALAYAKGLWYGYSNERWYQLNQPLLIGSFVLLSFVVIGARAALALPIALPANWIFRITAVHRPAAYFAAVRKSLFTLTVIPVWILSAILYFSIWPARPALEHMAVLVMTGFLLVDRALYQFRKIPFACSYLPGKANLKMKLGIYGVAFLFFADVGVQIEFWAMRKPARFLVLSAIFLATAVLANRHTAEFAAAPDNRIQFEDLPPAEVFALDLRHDGTWSNF